MIRHPGQSPLMPGTVSHGDLVITSGVVSPAVLAGDQQPVAAQLTAALDELAATLSRAGCDLADVMKLEAYLADAADFAQWNAAFERAWPDPAVRPARTTLVVGFALPAVRVELQAIAAVPQ